MAEENKLTSQLGTIADLVRKSENDFTSGETQVSKYVSVSMYDTLTRIDAYLNSKHISGDTDSLGREKPFFNIVVAAVNIWFRATDLDRKHMRIKSTKALNDIGAFLATIHLMRWMRKSRFGKYLNKWGMTLARYGSAVTKFVEDGDMLHISVIPWSRIICDQIDFASNPVIEILELTPAQLRARVEEMNYDKDMVEGLISAAQAARETTSGEKKDSKSEYIKLYEVHGELPMSYLVDDPTEDDDTTYRQQMHVVSYVKNKETGDYDDYCLYKGKEKKNPYRKDDLLEIDDQTLSIGAVQNLFESQWMVNHSMKAIKDQLDIFSKIVFQTADPAFVGQNVLDAIEQGDILIHEREMPLTRVDNSNNDITALQNFSSQWQALGNQINGISEAMLGINAKSGTAWRQTEALLQESQSLFEIMTENKALSLEEMMTDWIIPYAKKQMDTSEEVSSTLESYQIDKIDSIFVPNEAIKRYNERATEMVLEGEDVPLFEPELEQESVKAELSQQGNVRYFKPSDFDDKTWKEYFKDIEWEFEYDIVGEQKDMQMVMDTLNTALKYITTATPEQLADPNFKMVFNEILRATAVISPIQIASIPPPPRQQPTKEISKSMNYKDSPPDIQRQMEQQAGFQPSQATAPAEQANKPIKQKAK